MTWCIKNRIQQERFGDRINLYEEARGKYIVDRDVLDVMQKHAVVMHPLPRLDEVGFSSLFCYIDLHLISFETSHLCILIFGSLSLDQFQITVDVEVDPRAAYFRQAMNRIFIRMALLKHLLLGPVIRCSFSTNFFSGLPP